MLCKWESEYGIRKPCPFTIGYTHHHDPHDGNADFSRPCDIEYHNNCNHPGNYDHNSSNSLFNYNYCRQNTAECSRS